MEAVFKKKKSEKIKKRLKLVGKIALISLSIGVGVVGAVVLTVTTAGAGTVAAVTAITVAAFIGGAAGTFKAISTHAQSLATTVEDVKKAHEEFKQAFETNAEKVAPGGEWWMDKKVKRRDHRKWKKELQAKRKKLEKALKNFPKTIKDIVKDMARAGKIIDQAKAEFATYGKNCEKADDLEKCQTLKTDIELKDKWEDETGAKVLEFNKLYGEYAQEMSEVDWQNIHDGRTKWEKFFTRGSQILGFISTNTKPIVDGANALNKGWK